MIIKSIICEKEISLEEKLHDDYQFESSLITIKHEFKSFVESYEYDRVTEMFSWKITGKRMSVVLEIDDSLNFLSRCDAGHIGDIITSCYNYTFACNVSMNELTNIIKTAETTNVTINDTDFIRLNDSTYLRLKDGCLLKKKLKMINIIPFKYQGGIIQSNSVINIVKHFDEPNTIVFTSKNMTELWKHARIVTHDWLLKAAFDDEMELIDTKNISQFVIQESHHFIVTYIKKLLDAFNDVKAIWVINSMPLRYYSANQSTFFPLMNTWMRLSLENKRKVKHYICKSLITNIRDYFFIANVDRNPIEKIHIPVSSFEAKIKSTYQRLFNQWATSCEVNDRFHMYHNIMNAVVGLYSSMIPADKLEQRIDELSIFNTRSSDVKIPIDYKCALVDDCDSEVFLSCRHTFCFECFVSWYSSSNKCPICRNLITKYKILLKKTVSISFIDFFQQMTANDVIVTHYTDIHLLNNNKATVIFITSLCDVQTFSKMGNVDRVFLLRDNYRTANDIYENIIGYCRLFNNGPKIIDLVI